MITTLAATLTLAYLSIDGQLPVSLHAAFLEALKHDGGEKVS